MNIVVVEIRGRAKPSSPVTPTLGIAATRNAATNTATLLQPTRMCPVDHDDPSLHQPQVAHCEPYVDSASLSLELPCAPFPPPLFTFNESSPLLLIFFRIPTTVVRPGRADALWTSTMTSTVAILLRGGSWYASSTDHKELHLGECALCPSHAA